MSRATRILADPMQPLPARQSTTVDLEMLGDYIRRLWIDNFRLYRQRMTGKFDSSYGAGALKWDGMSRAQSPNGRETPNVWPGLAKFAAANQLNPVTWIRVFFHSWTEQRPPTPPALKYDATLQKVRAYMAISQQQIALAFQLQQKAARSRIEELHRPPCSMPTGLAVRYVIADTTLDLSSLFRYCLASQAKITDLALQHFNEALVQYVFDRRDYDATWGDVIPQRLRAAADRFCRPGGAG